MEVSGEGSRKGRREWRWLGADPGSVCGEESEGVVVFGGELFAGLGEEEGAEEDEWGEWEGKGKGVRCCRTTWCTIRC